MFHAQVQVRKLARAKHSQATCSCGWMSGGGAGCAASTRKRSSMAASCALRPSACIGAVGQATQNVQAQSASGKGVTQAVAGMCDLADPRTA